jgi:O-antigen ligase
MTSIAYAALWIFVFTLPWEAVVSVGGVATVSRATGALALGIALVAVATTGRFRRLHLFHVAALLFVIWAGFEFMVLSNSVALPKKFWKYVQLFLVLWMIWELAPSWRRQLGLLTAYVLGAYVATFNTLLLYRREAGGLRRFSAGATDPNDLAMTLALALPMAWYLGMSHRQTLLRWLCRAYLPVGFLAIGLTGSRGGLLTTIVALLIVPLTMDRLTPGRLVTAVVVLAGAAGLAVAYVPDKIVERLSTTRAEVQDASFGNRFTLWVAGVHAFERRPMMGYGTGEFVQAVRPELGSRSNVAHNTYLSVLVEQGIVGLTLFLTMLVAVYRSVLRLPKLERRFALLLLATLAIAMLPLTWEDQKAVWFILAALLGLSQAWVAAGGGVPRPLGPAPAGPALHPRAAAGRLQPLTTPSADRDAIA